MTESKYGKHIVTELTERFDSEFAARYAQWGLSNERLLVSETSGYANAFGRCAYP
jgi:hypothetical protein